jgi:hypothetical protein
MSTEAENLAPTRRRGDQGASGPGLALAQSGEDDDTDYDATGTRLAARRDYRPATRDYWRSTPPAGTPSDSTRRLAPSPTARTGQHRPGRGSARPDKETP